MPHSAPPNSPGRAARNGFDKLARFYRALEYLSFGPLLWRTRIAFLPAVQSARRALVLGDGDGRFAAALLRSNREVRVDAVDASRAMLHRLQERAARQGDASRVHTLHTDATITLPAGPYDLICTHFFLDCLTEAQCRVLSSELAGRMMPSGRWVISEFAVPANALRLPARALLRFLYGAFRLLTGLRVQQLPDYASALRAAGLCHVRTEARLGGILRAELWVLAAPGGTEAALQTSKRYERPI